MYYVINRFKKCHFITNLFEIYQNIKMNRIFLFACLALVIIAVDPPVFPDEYEVSFNESTKLGPLSGKSTGRIYFDAKNNRQVITRTQGHHDRYCATVYKFANTPCNHYVANNKRYLDFPDKKYCCYCCDSSHGCGIVAKDWLVKGNATFEGTTKLQDGQQYAKWEIKGLQSNFYYNRQDELNTPRRLDQGGSDLMDFYNYKVGITDPSIFNIPSYCKDTCGATTICAALRNQILRQE